MKLHLRIAPIIIALLAAGGASACGDSGDTQGGAGGGGGTGGSGGSAGTSSSSGGSAPSSGGSAGKGGTSSSTGGTSPGGGSGGTSGTTTIACADPDSTVCSEFIGPAASAEALAQACEETGDNVLPSCPTEGLSGICAMSSASATVRNFLYGFDAAQTAEAAQSCEESGGEWSTTP